MNDPQGLKDILLALIKRIEELKIKGVDFDGMVDDYYVQLKVSINPLGSEGKNDKV